MAEERMTPGPAIPAPTPVRVRMPVPTIAPTPSAMRCGHPRLRLSRCSAGISSSATTALRANRSIGTPLFLLRLDRQGRGGRTATCGPILGNGMFQDIPRRVVAADQEVPLGVAVDRAA